MNVSESLLDHISLRNQYIQHSTALRRYQAVHNHQLGYFAHKSLLTGFKNKPNVRHGNKTQILYSRLVGLRIDSFGLLVGPNLQFGIVNVPVVPEVLDNSVSV